MEQSVTIATGRRLPMRMQRVRIKHADRAPLELQAQPPPLLQLIQHDLLRLLTQAIPEERKSLDSPKARFDECWSEVDA